MELWDVYDINRSKTNQTWVRGEKLQHGDFHLVIQVCIFHFKRGHADSTKAVFQRRMAKYVGSYGRRERNHRRDKSNCCTKRIV